MEARPFLDDHKRWSIADRPNRYRSGHLISILRSTGGRKSKVGAAIVLGGIRLASTPKLFVLLPTPMMEDGTMVRSIWPVAIAVLGVGAGTMWFESRAQERSNTREAQPVQGSPERDALAMIKEGRQIFRYDTFGDEAFWGDALKLHHAIAGEAQGGVGDGVSPNTALKVGLKVDMEALPAELVEKIKSKQVDLDDPGHDGRASEARRGRWRQRLFGKRQAGVGRHYLCDLPLDGGRRLRAWHRAAARWLAQS
jgi:hypothetical protein